VGQTYTGKVVNITKFGAFVNILPGRDGLLHISKLGGGKRIDRVEDVVDLGDTIEVVVEDVDPNGKVSLRPAGDVTTKESAGSGRGERSERSDRGDRGDRGERSGRSDRGDRGRREERPAQSAPAAECDREYVSFEDTFDDEVRTEFGDLGPESTTSGGGGSGGRGRGGDRGRRR